MKSKPTEEQLKILKENMEMISPITSEEWAKFSQLWTCIKAPKKKTITRPGEVEPYLYFVLGGLQRIYHLSEEGKEATIIFSYPYSFSGVLDSAMTQTSSNYFFETLSESVLLRAPIDRFLQSTKENGSIGTFVHLALSHNIKGLLHRLVEIQSLKADEKFKLFMKRSPHMLQIVPHRYLANYLGIDPTNFSKFINKIII
ncbi:Crp/Fnr family transcriptional regulator [Pedobacter sp. ASV1-7]|uniref:Crp/Fnr family transcriptional regulator n=1 Tax=Pedobacter sp. ASV1-7 TaxID=3145237 RepID=UPI0032E8C211